MTVRPRGVTTEGVGIFSGLRRHMCSQGSPDVRKPSAEWRNGLYAQQTDSSQTCLKENLLLQ